MLPLFPLGTVLFPGLVLPLHVFEQRYRQLVRDLLTRPEQDRQFGVVAIREGREVGEHAATALFDVGCAALLQQVERHGDGRFDLLTVGSRLFRLTAVHPPAEHPYLTADVVWLEDEVGDAAQADQLATSVRAALEQYLLVLGRVSSRPPGTATLPAESLALSHLVAATVPLDLADRQHLLEQPDGCSRLRQALALIKRETRMLDTLGAAPAPELTRSPYSQN